VTASDRFAEQLHQVGATARCALALGVSVAALTTGAVAARAQQIATPPPAALSVAPAQISVVVGHESDPVTVNLRLPHQPSPGTGTLLLRTLPAGVTTSPGPATYPYQGSVAALLAPPTPAATSFRFVAGAAARPGQYEITIADGTFAVGNATITLTVVSAGDIGIRFGRAPLPLCGGAAAEDTVTFTSLAGYEGRPSAYWSTVPAGLTVTPRELGVAALPPEQTVRFSVQTAGAAPGRYALVLTVADRNLGIAKTVAFEVRVGGCGDVGIAFRKPVVSLCAGGESADNAVTLTPAGGYQGRPSLRWEGVPQGLAVTPMEPGPPDLPPAPTLPFSLRSSSAPAGTYTLRLRAADPAAGVDSSADLRVEVAGPDFTPSVTPGSATVQAAGRGPDLLAGLEGNPCFAARTVAISVSGAPAGVSVTPASAEVTGPGFGPARFAVDVGRQAQAGMTFTLTFTFQPAVGTAKTAPVTISVAAAPDYQLTVIPARASAAAGETIDVAVGARPVDGFSGTVYVTAPQIPGLSFSPPTFALQVGRAGGAGAAAGDGSGVTQTVTVSVSRRRPPGPIHATFTGDSPSAPGPHAAAIELVILPLRPTERVEGPRIDIVTPDTLEPGKQYDLELTGKNLTLDTSISLGRDVMLIGTPIFTLPTRATVRVQVGPAALPGVRVAEASNREGSNQGPGGIRIGLPLLIQAPTGRKPACAQPTVLRFRQGTITLEQPIWKRSVDESWSAVAIPVLDDDTVFQWREQNPGAADFFELRLIDTASGKVLLRKNLRANGEAGPPTYFRPDPAFLGELYAVLAPPATPHGQTYHVAPAGGVVAATTSSAIVQGGHAPSVSKSVAGVAPGAGTPFVHAETGLVAGGLPAAPGPMAGADLLWEVAGIRAYKKECVEVPQGQEAHLLSPSLSWFAAGKPEEQGERVAHSTAQAMPATAAAAASFAFAEVEISERWPLMLPEAPSGLECAGGARTHGSLQVDNRSDKKVYDKDGNAVVKAVVNGQPDYLVDVNNYPGDLFLLSGTFDLSRSPYAAHPKAYNAPPAGHQKIGDIVNLDFDNLFVDWGDGTVERARTLYPESGQDLAIEWRRDLRLRLPGLGEMTVQTVMTWRDPITGETYETKAPVPVEGVLTHQYREKGDFVVRFLQLPESDAQATSPLFLGLAADGTIGEYPGLVAVPNKAAVAGAREAVNRAYVLFCKTVTITQREDPAASGPLRLVSAAITGFPGYGEHAAERAGLSGAEALVGPATDAAKIGATAETPGPGPAANPARVQAAPAAAAPTARPGTSGPVQTVPATIPAFTAGPQGTVTVTDCDEAFTAQARLLYVGRGRARVRWLLDGKVIGADVVAVGPSPGRKDLPRDRTTWPPEITGETTLQSPPLSVETIRFHEVRVDVEVVPELTTAALEFADKTAIAVASGAAVSEADRAVAAGILGEARKAAPKSGGLGVLRPTTVGAAGAPAWASAQSAVESFMTGWSSHTGWTLKNDPPRYVVSDPSNYRVVLHDPNQPCVFLFPTKFGEFRISNLQGNTTKTGSSFSGHGTMLLSLTKSASDAAGWPVQVSFSGWEAADLWHVTKGALDVKPSTQLSGPALAGTLDRLEGTAGAAVPLEATFTLTLKDDQLRIPGQVEKPSSWTATAPITAAGDWYSDGQTLAPGNPEGILIYWSAFKIQSSDVRLDWSRSQGSGASPKCGPGSGPAWVGVHLGAATLRPYVLDLVQEGGGTYSKQVSDWAIVDGGMCGAIDSGPFSAKRGEGWLKFDAIRGSVGGGAVDATYTNMSVWVPWPGKVIQGDGALQAGGGRPSGIHFPFTVDAPPLEYNDPSDRITMTARNLFFTSEEGLGWTVRADADFAFKAEGKPFATVPTQEMFFTFDGRAAFDKGGSSRTVALSGTTTLGDTPLDLLSVQLSAAKSGSERLAFAFKTTAHLSETLPAKEVQVNYAIERPGADYVGGGPPTYSKFDVQFGFPAGQPVLEVALHPVYDGSQDTRFYGPVDIGMFGGPAIQAHLLIGYEQGKSYWLTRLSYPLGPTGQPLVPPFLNLYEMHGAFGYNISDDDLKNKDISNVQPDWSGNVKLLVGTVVGSPDGGFALTMQGDLTISSSKQRMDFGAWLLSLEHSGTPNFTGYFQFAGGSFDGKLWGTIAIPMAFEFDLGDSEGNAAVALHAGNGSWYVHAGERNGARIAAKFCNYDCTGYLMLGSEDGLQVGAGVGIYLGCSLGHISGNVEAGCGITPGPKISGYASGNVKAEVCAFDVCIGPSIDVSVQISAPPVSMTCNACIGFDLGPLGHPEKCGDFTL
jgi:hypothetical protein